MNPFVQALEIGIEDLKSWLLKSETWLVSLIKQEWALDRQILIQDLSNDLKTFGKTVQESNGGISGKELGSALLSAVEGQFEAQVASMLWQDVLLAVSLATQALNPPQVQGNGGVLQGGDSGPQTP